MGYGDIAKDKRPAEVRAELPLAWAVGHLYGIWIAGNEMVPCPLPGHQDDTPSFNLWAVDSSGLPQRFGCFGCGTNGDVIDLIRIRYQVEFYEAMNKATSELIPAFKRAKWEPVLQSPTAASKKTATELEDIFAELSKPSAYGHEAMDRFCLRKGLGGEHFQLYSEREWQWGGAGPGSGGRTTPVVYFPHRDPFGALTGIKFRDPRMQGGRWTEEGSRFPFLYGAWRDNGASKVILCEGETDTVWAAYSVSNLPEFSVLGLPTGANAAPTEEQLSQLKGRRVYLAFDGDAPGFRAAKRWYEALSASETVAKVIRLPEGEDILSCGIPVLELLREWSTTPRKDLSRGISIAEDVFVKPGQSKKGAPPTLEPIADFAFTPVVEYKTEDEGPAWDVRFVDDGTSGLLRVLDIQGSSFSRWAARYGGRSYLGNVSTLPLLQNWVNAQSAYIPLEKATTKAGKSGRSYVWPGGCIGPDRVKYIPPAKGDVKLEGKLHIVKGSWDRMSIRALEKLTLDEGKMSIMLGWLTATLLRGQTSPAPPLFVSGESGSGKTKLVEAFLGVFGFDIANTLTTTTPYGVDSMVSSTVGFPVWFDEYRVGARQDSMTRVRQILRDAYNGQASVKGGMSNDRMELSETTTWSGIIVSGEMGTNETSHLDRIVAIELTPAGRNRDAMNWLTDNAKGTVGLGWDFLQFLADRRVPFRPDPLSVPGITSDRFRNTLGFVQAGHVVWREFREWAGVKGDPAPPSWDELITERESGEDPWMEALRHCLGRSSYGGPVWVEQHEDGCSVLAYDVVNEAQRVGIEVPARANELVKWLRARYPGMSQRRIVNQRGWFVPGLFLDEGSSESAVLAVKEDEGAV